MHGEDPSQSQKCPSMTCNNNRARSSAEWGERDYVFVPLKNPPRSKGRDFSGD
jgi:hypothetical protein